MKRKIAAFALAISMVVTGIFQPMTTMANETVQTTQTVAGCSYEVTLPDDYATGDRNYPVIYVMPQNGLAKDNSGLTEELQTAMKSETGMDMIVVRPTFKAGMDLHDVMEDRKSVV